MTHIAEERLVAYALDDAAPEDRAAIEAHLRQCVACRDARDELAQALHLLRLHELRLRVAQLRRALLDARLERLVELRDLVEGLRVLDRDRALVRERPEQRAVVADQAIAKANFRDSAEEQILVQGKGSLKATDAQFKAAVSDTVARIEHVKGVDKVKSPYADGNAGQLAKDGRSALITFEIPGNDTVTEARVDATLAATAGAQKANPQVFVGQFGDASADKAISKAFEDDFKKAEVLSLPITLLILIVAFGSLVAAGVPLLLGVTAVAATIGLLAPISQLFPMDESAGSVVLLVGLAVGVDYSMFYMRRKMEERDAGRSPEQALEFAAATSGQAVLISGLTVMIAMAGMFFAGSIVFQSFAIGTILVVGISVLETTHGTTVANLGFEAVAFPAPVFHGDTLHAESEVVAARASGSREDAGIVTFEHRGFNQRDELVCRARRVALMSRRPA